VADCAFWELKSKKCYSAEEANENLTERSDQWFQDACVSGPCNLTFAFLLNSNSAFNGVKTNPTARTSTRVVVMRGFRDCLCLSIGGGRYKKGSGIVAGEL
jgi:hypothetical protein